MRRKVDSPRTFRKLILALIPAAFLVFNVSSCGSDDSDVTPAVTPPGEGTAEGSVSFTIGGAAAAGAPVSMSKEAPLSLAISQKSTLTTTDGTVLSCEPAATVEGTVLSDTAFAKTLQELTAVSEKTETRTAGAGTGTVRTTTVQTFTIGGQTVTFTRAYDVCTLTTPDGKSIEMPYVMPGTVKYGEAQKEEKTRAGVTVAAVAGIRLKPVEQTRGITVRDTTLFEVSVRFNMDIESVNTESDNRQTLEFDVGYIGAVEDVTELPDPSTDYSYAMNPPTGTESKSSPFVLGGKGTMTLAWSQQARYTWWSPEDLTAKVISYEPKATVKLSAALDTVWVSEKSQLEKTAEPISNIATEGNLPTVTLAKQEIAFGGQTVTLEWDYESYDNVEVEGNTLAMPYLKLGEAKLISTSIQEIEGAHIPNKDTKIYEVTLTLSQELTGVNTPDEISQELQYVVKYIGVEEVELISVKYRKDWVWEDPHDNIPLTSRYIIYRDRTYSTGETFTDTFYSGLCGVEFDFDIYGSVDVLYEFLDGDKYYRHPYKDRWIKEDYLAEAYTRTGVTDISRVRVVHDREEYGGYNEKPGEKLAHYTNMFSGEKFNPEVPTDGWYFNDIGYISFFSTYYDPLIDDNINDWYIRTYYTMIRFYDRFRYLDGQIIDFYDEQMTFNVSQKETAATMPDGSPARVLQFIETGKYLGKEFSYTLTDTIYQLK